jgi:hypothetical protein
LIGAHFVVPLIEKSGETPTRNSQDAKKAPGNDTAQADSSENQAQKWSKPEVQQLLILYKAHEDKFQDPKWKKKAIWKEISKEMNQYGYLYTSEKCQVKFKNLKQTYVKTVDHNNKSGNSLKTCSFFDELNEIFACNPFVEPVAECSNRKGYKAVDKKAVDEEEEKDSSPGLRSTANKDSKQRKQKPPKRRFSVTESLTSIQEEMKKENETRMKTMEEMHKEKMQRFDRLLDLYERDLSAEK